MSIQHHLIKIPLDTTRIDSVPGTPAAFGGLTAADLTSRQTMLDQLRQQIQTHLDELLGEADKLRHALAAQGLRCGRWAPSARINVGWPFAVFGSGRLTVKTPGELGALALGQTAECLAGRDPAAVHDLGGLHPAVLGERDQHVEHLCRLKVRGRVEQQRDD